MVCVPLSNVTVFDDVMTSLIPPGYENTRTKITTFMDCWFLLFYDYML